MYLCNVMYLCKMEMTWTTDYMNNIEFLELGSEHKDGRN